MQAFMLDNNLLVAVLVVLVSDSLAFAWLVGVRRQMSRGAVAGASPLMLLLVLAVMVFAHFLALRLVWQQIDPLAADSATAMAMVALTIFPGAPPALLYAWILVESTAEHSINRAAGFGTARKQESDYSRAKTLGARGQIDAAVAAYREYYNADPKNPKPLFQAYRLLYTKNRREESVEILREIMKTFSKDPQIWARAATELANYYQNDERDSGRARHILHDIMKKAPTTEHGRLAGGRLTGAWSSTSYWTPPEF